MLLLETLADSARNQRKTLKKTQNEIAAMAEVNRKTVIAFEQGKNVGLWDAAKILRALNLEMTTKPIGLPAFENLLDVFKD